MELFEDNVKRNFEARSDMAWKDFNDCIVAQLESMEVHLNYHLNMDMRAWLDLSCKADFVDVMKSVAEKCLVARIWKVVMEVKNLVSKLGYP